MDSHSEPFFQIVRTVITAMDSQGQPRTAMDSYNSLVKSLIVDSIA